MPETKHVCAVCGRRYPMTKMIYSKWTKNRYCRDVDACRRRAKRPPKERCHA